MGQAGFMPRFLVFGWTEDEPARDFLRGLAGLVACEDTLESAIMKARWYVTANGREDGPRAQAAILDRIAGKVHHPY